MGEAARNHRLALIKSIHFLLLALVLTPRFKLLIIHSLYINSNVWLRFSIFINIGLRFMKIVKNVRQSLMLRKHEPNIH